jgi:DNA-binding LacI/PurR family transcriptional regulator
VKVATLKDVAKLAGVSYATVSRVLAKKPNIRAETIERVMHAVNELGYTTNRTARSLRNRKSNIIGVIVSDIRYEFFPPVVRAIEDVASKADYAVLLCNSDENPEKERKYIELLIDENVAGAIIAPTGKGSHAFEGPKEASMPVVLIDRKVDGFETDLVVVDNYEAAYSATTHLLDHGFERIGAIVGSNNATTAEERFQGYQQALVERGLAPDRALVRRGPPSFATGTESMKALLALDERPGAVFISNHLLAAGAFKALHDHGHGVAYDIGIVAFDDLPWAAFVSPSVTTVRQPTYEIGRHAIEMLLRRIDGYEGPFDHRVLSTELQVRESSMLRAPSARAHPAAREVPME